VVNCLLKSLFILESYAKGSIPNANLGVRLKPVLALQYLNTMLDWCYCIAPPPHLPHWTLFSHLVYSNIVVVVVSILTVHQLNASGLVFPHGLVMSSSGGGGGPGSPPMGLEESCKKRELRLLKNK